MTGVRITLNPEECVIVAQIGMMKTNNSISGGLQTSWARAEGFNMYLTDINGYGAELAFCKMFNLCPDLTSHNRVGGFDAKLPDGTTVDVKQSRSLTTDLRVKCGRKKLGDSSLYALLVGGFPTYTFVGFTEESVVFESPITQVWEKDHYTVARDKLMPVQNLKEFGVINIFGDLVDPNE